MIYFLESKGSMLAASFKVSRKGGFMQGVSRKEHKGAKNAATTAGNNSSRKECKEGGSSQSEAVR
jgi:hypothetical protein